MDASQFSNVLESEKQTELDRLGSEKLLVALTDASLDRETVLGAVADSEYAAAETFEELAEDEPHEQIREAFGAVAEQERTHYDHVTASLDSHEPPENGGPMHAYLRGLDGSIERVAAGLVGRPLVSTRTHLQVISYFVNEADSPMADVFRELKAETDDELNRGLRLLEDNCETDADWERAKASGEYVIQVAYDTYADALQGLGLDPKPLC